MVPITDRSFLYGDGCFEGIGVINGRILHLDDHLERLERSARALRISLPLPLGRLRDVVIETATSNDMGAAPVAYLRVLVSRGSGHLGLRNTSRLERPHIYVIPHIHRERSPSDIQVYRAACTTVQAPPASTLDPRIKSNNYLWHVLALLDAQRQGADLAVHCTPDGFVTECHAMNIFCVRGDRLSTPPEPFVLGGITRRNVVHLAREIGFDVHAEFLTPYDFANADEVFVTGSLDLIGAVSAIDGVELVRPVPGERTVMIRNTYLRDAIAAGTAV